MKLTPTMERFVLHWGEMGQRWGVNRSVAQIHALLYLATKPLDAETIAETLGIARSNVSTGLRELMAWDLVRVVHVLGDRRDHFEAETDNWRILLSIAEGRKRREIDPTLSTLRGFVLDAEADRATDPAVKARIEGLMQFVEVVSGWYEQVRRIPAPTLLALLKMGAKIARAVRP
jgi:DNA-binding transcriptional regulator GbsR (MarR family)